ncbi:hypothetical protein TD95_004677 [Thielaviopsis punctulata]|uniref:Zn(2)-C6 fungal-type domain-containing protein n=1 Tax=Thielaviopsis punctulata TaxID=72032 RepID=A0A0F4Z9J3_9PEZI|nr:hypothetical protein TD95_004677 [Thielaviopsis punctulata]
MLLYTRLAPAKIPKKRSRTAETRYLKAAQIPPLATELTRLSVSQKKKCNEAHPQCNRCQEKGQECIYEPVRPRQRRRRRSDTTSTSAPSRAPASPPRQPPAKSPSSQPGASITLSALQPDAPKRPANNAANNADNKTPRLDTGLDVSLEDLADLPLMSPDDEVFDAAMLALENMQPGGFTGLDMFGLDFDMLGGDSPDDGSLDSCSSDSSGNSPEDASFAALQAPADNNMLVRADMSGLSVHDLHDGIFGPQAAVHFTTPYSDMRTFASPPPPQTFFERPSFYDFPDLRNRRALIDHFCNVLSHLLVFKEERGNPFQQLVLPLCRTSLVVGNAVYALASAHLEYRGVVFSESSEFFHRQAITGLAGLIAQGDKADKSELLAAIVLLIYYEVAFRFHDVISSLSLGRAPMSTTYTDTASLTESTSSSLRHIDSLLGMFTTLWPILHRLACLQAIKRDLTAALSAGTTATAAILKTEFETRSAAIEIALDEWQPAVPNSYAPADGPGDTSTDPSTPVLHPTHGRLQSILNNALAYRHSGSVFLYRSMYRCAQDHPLVQRHTHAALVHCMRTVQNAGPMSALLWPLFVAACEARTEEDRELARKTFLAVDRRQGMVNIQNAWTIVQEVWKRVDEKETGEKDEKEEDEDLWRIVSNDLGITVVLG